MNDLPTEADLVARLAQDVKRLNDNLLQMRSRGLAGTWRFRTHVPGTMVVVHLGEAHVPREPLPLRARARAVVDNLRAAGLGGLGLQIVHNGLRQTARALTTP